jgi:cytochrome bd-type quinol oxidase subunit 1
MSTLNFELQLAEQNVTANWVRNGLIATLVALTLYGLLSLYINRPNHQRWLKIISIIIIVLAIIIFWVSSSVSRQIWKTTQHLSAYPSYYYQWIGYILILPLIAIIGLIILS